MYQTACHLAAEVVLNTGKRPGVICGMQIKDILEAEQEKHADGNDVMRVKVVPECPYGVFKTVTVSVMKLELEMYNLLKRFCTVHQSSEAACPNDRIFTSIMNLPLRNLQDLF